MSRRHPPRQAATPTDLAVHATALERQLARARQDLAGALALNAVLLRALIPCGMRPAPRPTPHSTFHMPPSAEVPHAR